MDVVEALPFIEPGFEIDVASNLTGGPP